MKLLSKPLRKKKIQIYSFHSSLTMSIKIFFCILYPQRNIIEQKKGELDGEMKGKEDTISTNFLSLCMIALITLLGV